MKAHRLPGTCFNGVHWLKFENCDTCSLKVKCIELNAGQQEKNAQRKTEQKSESENTPQMTNTEAGNSESTANNDVVRISKATTILQHLLRGGPKSDLVTQIGIDIEKCQKDTEAQVSAVLGNIKRRIGCYRNYTIVEDGETLKIQKV